MKTDQSLPRYNNLMNSSNIGQNFAPSPFNRMSPSPQQSPFALSSPSSQLSNHSSFQQQPSPSFANHLNNFQQHDLHRRQMIQEQSMYLNETKNLNINNYSNFIRNQNYPASNLPSAPSPRNNSSLSVANMQPPFRANHASPTSRLAHNVSNEHYATNNRNEHLSSNPSNNIYSNNLLAYANNALMNNSPQDHEYFNKLNATNNNLSKASFQGNSLIKGAILNMHNTSGKNNFNFQANISGNNSPTSHRMAVQLDQLTYQTVNSPLESRSGSHDSFGNALPSVANAFNSSAVKQNFSDDYTTLPKSNSFNSAQTSNITTGASNCNYTLSTSPSTWSLASSLNNSNNTNFLAATAEVTAPLFSEKRQNSLGIAMSGGASARQAVSRTETVSGGSSSPSLSTTTVEETCEQATSLEQILARVAAAMHHSLDLAAAPQTYTTVSEESLKLHNSRDNNSAVSSPSLQFLYSSN